MVEVVTVTQVNEAGALGQMIQLALASYNAGVHAGGALRSGKRADADRRLAEAEGLLLDALAACRAARAELAGP